MSILGPKRKWVLKGCVDWAKVIKIGQNVCGGSLAIISLNVASTPNSMLMKRMILLLF